jgi:hypothetical protein
VTAIDVVVIVMGFFVAVASASVVVVAATVVVVVVVASVAVVLDYVAVMVVVVVVAVAAAVAGNAYAVGDMIDNNNQHMPTVARNETALDSLRETLSNSDKELSDVARRHYDVLHVRAPRNSAHTRMNFDAKSLAVRENVSPVISCASDTRNMAHYSIALESVSNISLEIDLIRLNVELISYNIYCHHSNCNDDAGVKHAAHNCSDASLLTLSAPNCPPTNEISSPADDDNLAGLARNRKTMPASLSYKLPAIFQTMAIICRSSIRSY